AAVCANTPKEFLLSSAASQHHAEMSLEVRTRILLVDFRLCQDISPTRSIDRNLGDRIEVKDQTGDRVTCLVDGNALEQGLAGPWPAIDNAFALTHDRHHVPPGGPDGTIAIMSGPRTHRPISTTDQRS